MSGEESIHKFKNSDMASKIGDGADEKVKQFDKFTKTFSDELKKGFKELSDDVKKKQGR